MKRWLYIIPVAALGIAALAAAPARADALDHILKTKTIRVATDMTIPPSGMLDKNLKPTGSDVKTAELLAKDWGLKLEFIKTTQASRIPNLLSDKADVVISTLSITPERAKVIDFTRPYAALQSVIACVKSDDVRNWADLKGKSVAVSRGTTQDAYLSNMKNRDFKIVRYEDEATTVTAAATGQANCMANSATIVAQVGKANPARPFVTRILLQNLYLAMGVRKDEPHLKARLNEWIAANLKNGKLNEIYQRFHGAALPEALQKGKVK